MHVPKPSRATRRALTLGVTVAALAAGLIAAPVAQAVAVNPPLTATPATSTHTVTLITGERIAVINEPGAAPRYLVDKGGVGGYQSYQDTNGDEYVIPAIAQPYLGRGLDRSLFDVSALVRDGLDDGVGQLPVALSFAPGTTPTALPGITLTATSASTATGYLTPASTSAFVAALRSRIGADVAAGHRPGTSQPVAGLTGISLAADGTSPVVTPAYALYPLQINVTDLTGAPVTGYVFLFNIDSLGKQTTQVLVESGIARIEVPAGDYAAVADFGDYDDTGQLVSFHQVVQQGFVVQANANTPALNIAETQANLPISIRTPRPATQEILSVEEVLGDAAGKTYGVGNVLLGNAPFYVNATPAPPVGTAHFVAAWTGAATNTSDNYAYDVAFPSDSGVPANETYVVRPDQLATVHQRLSTDPTATGGGAIFDGALDKVDTSAFAFAVGHAMGVPLTHYFGTADGGEYFQAVLTANLVLLHGPTLTFVGRHQYVQDWAHGPLTTGTGQYVGRADCVACSTGNTLDVEFNLVNDSSPDHTGGGFFQSATSEHLTVYENGTQLVNQDGYTGVTLTGIPLTPTIYRAVLDQDYTGAAGHSQSLLTHTDLTMRYDPKPDPGSTLPAGDDCYNGQAYVVGAACQILPVLTVNYQLPSDLTNTSHSALQTLGLTVGHQSYSGFGSHSRITSTSLAISFDGGLTWRPVPLLGREGHYVAAWRNPPAGSDVTLKVTARDADGDAITQTVSNAYTVGGAK